MTAAALLLLTILSIGALPFWRDLPMIPRFRLREGIVLTLAVATLGAAAWLAVNGPRHSGAERELGVTMTVAASLAAGGPVTTSLLRLADRGTPAAPQGPAQTTVLTGGAWIGALERIAVTATLLARWPDGLALILAVKGLGRYPELRGSGRPDQSGTAERFIVGTLTSALWATACAGVGLALLR